MRDRSPSRAAKATVLRSGDSAGEPMMRACGLLQISRVAPGCSDQRPSRPTCPDTYKRRSGPNRGVEPFAATSEGPDAVAAAPSVPGDRRQRLVRGVAIVVTRREPSALAASDV